MSFTFFLKYAVVIILMMTTVFLATPHLVRKKKTKDIMVIASQNAITCGFFSFFFTPVKGAGENFILIVSTLIFISIFIVALVATLKCRFGKNSKLLCFLQEHNRLISWGVLLGEAISPYIWNSQRGVVATFIATTFVRFVCLPDENQLQTFSKVESVKLKKFLGSYMLVIKTTTTVL